MRSMKQTALDIADLLFEAEQAAPSDELQALHDALRLAMYEQRDNLGFTDEDVVEIDNHLTANRGGTPKTPPPDGGQG